jgi:dTDP-4-dehydrorhamnose reductase
MKIFITGCNGQLGRALNKIYENNKEVELINTDVEQLDITNVEQVVAMIVQVKPDVIINCAAHTGVDACETDIENAYKINAIGPRNLSIAATKVGAKMVHISTDYVFDGNGENVYSEFDKTNPQGVYGKTKLEGEKFVAQFAQKYFIIRTAWLYGEGKNFVKTMLRLSETNQIVSVVNDQFGTPTSTKEVAKMIKHLIPTDNYGLFHGTCEGQCSWADFAKEIFKLAKKDVEVKGITTAEYPTPAKRPAFSVLDNAMLQLTTDFEFCNWKQAIAEYMNENW